MFRFQIPESALRTFLLNHGTFEKDVDIIITALGPKILDKKNSTQPKESSIAFLDFLELSHGQALPLAFQGILLLEGSKKVESRIVQTLRAIDETFSLFDL